MHIRIIHITSFFFSFLFVSAMYSQTITGSIMHDSEERHYRLYIPPGYSAGESLPLVFNLHGRTSNAVEQEFYSAMNTVADAGNFFVCYPDGIGEEWNVGFDFGNAADDVGFIDALIDALHHQYGIDLRRVYSCGMSNGGFMSYKLACELTNRFAAVASVAGSIVPGVDALCQPTRNIPVMEIHGTADAVVPYTGAAYAIPTEELIAQWVSRNGCAGTDTIDVPNSNTGDGSTAQRISYLDCVDGNEVVLYKVTGGGHSWPGAVFPIDVTNQDFSASVVIWEFFSRFTRDIESAVSVTGRQDPFISVQTNPFRENLQLQFLSSSTYQVRIFDQVGRQICRNSYPGRSTQTLDVQHWQAGVYVIVWETDKAYGSLQVIKS